MADMELDLRVLHGLAVKKSAGADQLAALLDIDESAAESALEKAVEAKDAMGARGIFMLTPAGRERLDAAYPEVFAGARADESMLAAADRFEVINRTLLDILTRWQSVPQAGTTVPNDHSNREYDLAILDELGDLHDLAEPIIGRMATTVARLGAYTPRLSEAYDRALAGENDYVSGVRVDSYHTIWHELHEDILRVLGRKRQE